MPLTANRLTRRMTSLPLAPGMRSRARPPPGRTLGMVPPLFLSLRHRVPSRRRRQCLNSWRYLALTNPPLVSNNAPVSAAPDSPYSLDRTAAPGTRHSRALQPIASTVLLTSPAHRGLLVRESCLPVLSSPAARGCLPASWGTVVASLGQGGWGGAASHLPGRLAHDII